MPGWFLFSIKLLVFLLFLSFSVHAQPLPVNPEKIQKAGETEQKAILTGDSLLLAEAYYLYGRAYTIAGDATTSQRYFLKSLALLEHRGDSFELGRIYCRLSESHKILTRRERIKYVQQAIAIFKRIGSLKGLVTAYGLLGQFYTRPFKNKVPNDSALIFFKKVEALGRQLKDTLVIGEANLHLAEFYGVETAEAAPYLQKAVHFLSMSKSKRAMLTAMVNLADSYIHTSQTKKGYELLVRTRKIYEQNKMADLELEMGLNKVLADYYAITKKYDLALLQYKKLNYKESLRFDQDKNEALLRLKTEYDTDKRETLLSAQKTELELNRKVLKTQRNFIIVTIVLLSIAVAMSILFFRTSRKNQLTSKRNKQLVREQNHRVKNNLQMISSLLSIQSRVLTDSNAKAVIQESRLRIQSMTLLQQKLYDGDNLSAVSLKDFIPELVEATLLACGYDATKQQYILDHLYLDIDRTTSLGLILTELVINACKYAFPGNNDPLLVVECSQKDKRITLVVKDNGPGLGEGILKGFDPKKNRYLGKSFGMQLLELQVNQLYGEFTFTNNGGAIFTMHFKV